MPRRADLRLSSVFVTIAVMAAFLMTGCSAITVPMPGDIIKTPLGTESIKIGMTKQQVESIWGKPDSVMIVENKSKWPGPREVWIYNAKYGAIPVSAGYLSETQKLYFDGINLTQIGE